MVGQPKSADIDAKTYHNLSLEQFADNLLQEKDLYTVDSATRDEMRADIVDRLEQVTNRVIIDNLSEDKLVDFEKLLDGNAEPGQMQEFVQQNVPHLETKLQDAYFAFRRLYLGL